MSRTDDLRSCPDPEILGAWLEGKLDGAEEEAVSAHVEQCDECLFLIREAGRDRERPAEPRTNGGWQWAIAAAIAFLIVTTAVVVIVRPRDPVQQLAAAMQSAGYRPFEGRLTDFPHASFRARRSSASGNAAMSSAAEAILQETHPRSAAEWHAAGIAQLTLEQYEDAVAALARAASLAPDSAKYHSDLAAARIGLATESSDPVEVQRAVADAERSVAVDPNLTAALFNRALALERLGRRNDAARAYAQYLAADATSPWADEARWRVERLSR